MIFLYMVNCLFSCLRKPKKKEEKEKEEEKGEVWVICRVGNTVCCSVCRLSFRALHFRL